MPDDDGAPSGFMGRGAQAHVNRSPLQRAGKDRLLRETTVPEEATGGDRSMYLDSSTLGKLLEMARTSRMGRVELRCVRLQVQLWQRRDGTTYETWTVLSAAPRPEPSPALGMPGLDP